VRAYWLACQRGQAPERNPLDAVPAAQRVRALKYGGHLTYEVYLRSRSWRTFRTNMLALVNGRCEHCDASESTSALLVLDVHHVHYDTLGAELSTDVVVLCRPCHEIAHAAARPARR
jgi:hypothetical protein